MDVNGITIELFLGWSRIDHDITRGDRGLDCVG
jgi:hypothetical protein